MPSLDLPFLGTIVLCTMMLCAAWTFGVSVVAGRGRPQLLPAARFGTYATVALVALAVFVLAYAFQAHDFRIRYVSRYSDRSMPVVYLVTALWGGQDGSLLWWTFLLSLYTGACTLWMRDRYRELQPYVLATLMALFLFFGVLMLFAANPFAVNVAGAPADGEGLNPLLQNYWMVIHPPTLYAGFVGWSIPFAFVTAALLSGRLHNEWLLATRRWTLFAWLALSCGNLLGMLWSYEELGWGGYWAWDPVENASFMPWLTGSAFLHSVMIQERRGMMKVWNVFLLQLTFFMTIFGTFLTRSGLIASVHSFARSDIGIYFAVFLVILLLFDATLLLWRLPLLRADNRLDSLLSREFAFLLNNWILLGMMLAVFGMTTAPLISEWLWKETITVGPGFYNRWMVPLGLVLLFLTGVGPLIAWRKATGKNLLQAFVWPTAASALAFALHALFGARAGFPPVVDAPEIDDTLPAIVIGKVFSAMPIVTFTLCTWVTVAIVQEFVRGTAMRMRNARENVAVALFRLVARARRRYGGYVVHIGIVLIFFGFMGAAYDREAEMALRPGQSATVGAYTLRYTGSRTDSDENKRMLFSDLLVSRGGRVEGRLTPAKFVYRTLPDMPTTEVAIASNLADDLYVILNGVNPDTRVATFKVLVRPFVAWIWIGGVVLILGTAIAIAPSLREVFAEGREGLRWAGSGRGGARAPAVAAAGLLALGVGVFASAATVSRARAQDASSLHAGHVDIHGDTERQVFERLLCTCGDCQRLPLTTCACADAEARRAEVRARLARGDTVDQIADDYRRRYGTKSIAIPPDEGIGRALWAVPAVAIALAAGGLVVLGRRWAARPAPSEPLRPVHVPAAGVVAVGVGTSGVGTSGGAMASAVADSDAAVAGASSRPEPEDTTFYDDALDDELRRLGD
jgi:cytochrome c-type biogenesis protein CcmF